MSKIPSFTGFIKQKNTREADNTYYLPSVGFKVRRIVAEFIKWPGTRIQYRSPLDEVAAIEIIFLGFL